MKQKIICLSKETHFAVYDIYYMKVLSTGASFFRIIFGFDSKILKCVMKKTKQNKRANTGFIPTYTGHGCRGPVQFKTRNYRLATVKSRLPVARHNLGLH